MAIASTSTTWKTADWKQKAEAKRDALMQSITDAVQALAAETDEVRASEQLAQYFAFSSKFHHYSFHNQILIQLQKPDATLVAGFQAWQKKYKRYVKKGETGIAILAPHTYVPKDKDQEQEPESGSRTLDSGDQPEKRKRLYFSVVYVFDVSQTEGEPLPAEPEWRHKEKSPEIEDALKALAASKGITVEIREEMGGAEGRCMPGLIQLLPSAGTHTFAHELAHMLYEHVKQRDISRQQREIEADTAAHVFSAHFGLSSLSANYLALWQAGKDDILACMQRVQGVAAEMIEAVESSLEEKED